MNKCFYCGAEYEGHICPKCGCDFNERQNDISVATLMTNVTELQATIDKKDADTHAVAKAVLVKIKDYCLEHARVVLFSLWAVFLWAFYIAKITKDPFELFSANLYQALKDAMYVELRPVLYVLLSLAIFSNVYVIVVGIISWKGNQKAKLISGCGAGLLQLAVFICAIVTKLYVVDIGLDNGDFVAVVSSFTAVFALLEIIFAILYSVEQNAVNDELKKITWQKTYQSNIKHAVIPHGIKEICPYAFGKCMSLKIVVIPDSVQYIGYNAFFKCTKLKTIIYLGTMEQWAKIYKSNLETNCTDVKIISLDE